MREPTASRAGPRPFVVAGAAIATAIAAGTAWLWAHYGSAVFFETIRAGFVACFG
jgi:hypothetical protein